MGPLLSFPAGLVLWYSVGLRPFKGWLTMHLLRDCQGCQHFFFSCRCLGFLLKPCTLMTKPRIYWVYGLEGFSLQLSGGVPFQIVR